MMKETMSTVITILLTTLLCLCTISSPMTANGAPMEEPASNDSSLNTAFEHLFSATTTKDSINAYNEIGLYLYNNNDFAKAAEMYRSALNISVSAGDKKNMAICYQNLGNALAMMNHLIDANECNLKALDLFYELNNEEAVSNVCKAIGIMCITNHLYKTATEYLERALAIDTVMNIRTGGNHAIDVAFDNLYLGYAELSKYRDTRSDNLLQQAKAKNLKAYRMLSKLKNDIGIVYCSKNLMDTYLECAKHTEGQQKQQLLDSSLMFHNLGKKLATELNIVPIQTDYIIWEAKYAIEKQQFDQARSLLRQIETTIDNNLDDTYLTEYCFLMANYYQAVGRYHQAYVWFNRATKIEKQQINFEFAVRSARQSVGKEFADILQQREIENEHERIVRREQEIRLGIVSGTTTIVMLMIIVLTIAITRSLKRKKRLEKELTERNEELELQKEQLEAINDQIASSINFAHHLQASMLPDISQMHELFSDVLILWRPLDLVSGDFYWGTRVGNRTLFTIADCTGHGVPGGFMSMLGISTLSDITLMPEFKSGQMTAGNVLDLMRDRVIESLRQSEDSQMSLDGMDMALCILDTETMEMQFAGAFRPVILVRDGELTEYKGDKMPVSYLSDNPRPFVTNRINVKEGDMVFIYSDGITDQFGYNDDGNQAKFAGRRLLKILKEESSKPFDELKQRIENAIDDWRAPAGKKSTAQTDDIIFLGVKI